MAGFSDEEDDGGMGLQMIPKPGTQVPAQQPGAQMGGAAVNMRPALAQAGSDNRAAQQGWEDAIRRKVGLPVQNAAGAIGDKLDSLFQGGEKKPLPSQVQPQINPDQMDALRNQMLADRAANGGQMTPESMAKFQRLKAAMMGQPQEALAPQKPMVAAQPEETQEE